MTSNYILFHNNSGEARNIQLELSGIILDLIPSEFMNWSDVYFNFMQVALHKSIYQMHICKCKTYCIIKCDKNSLKIMLNTSELQIGQCGTPTSEKSLTFLLQMQKLWPMLISSLYSFMNNNNING